MDGHGSLHWREEEHKGGPIACKTQGEKTFVRGRISILRRKKKDMIKMIRTRGNPVNEACIDREQKFVSRTCEGNKERRGEGVGRARRKDVARGARHPT